MIQAVLNDPVEKIVKIVFSAGNDFVETFVSESLNGLCQSLAGLEQTVRRAGPLRCASIRVRGPITVCADDFWHRRTLNGFGRRLHPVFYVQDKFPNRVA